MSTRLYIKLQQRILLIFVLLAVICCDILTMIIEVEVKESWIILQDPLNNFLFIKKPPIFPLRDLNPVALS